MLAAGGETELAPKGARRWCGKGHRPENTSGLTVVKITPGENTGNTQGGPVTAAAARFSQWLIARLTIYL